MTFSLTTISLTTISSTSKKFRSKNVTLSITVKNVTASITFSIMILEAECCYADCVILSVVYMLGLYAGYLQYITGPSCFVVQAPNLVLPTA